MVLSDKFLGLHQKPMGPIALPVSVACTTLADFADVCSPPVPPQDILVVACEHHYAELREAVFTAWHGEEHTDLRCQATNDSFSPQKSETMIKNSSVAWQASGWFAVSVLRPGGILPFTKPLPHWFPWSGICALSVF